MKINKTFMVNDVKVLDEADGIVEAFVNTMGMIDKDSDIISPSAFDKSILKNLPIPVLSGHDQSSLVGKVTAARSQPVTTDEYQLYAKMQMNMDTQAGRDAFSNVSGNYIREWSVGFNIPDPESDIKYEEIEGKTIRKINNLDWVEVSTVVRGASPMTETISAKIEKGAIPSHETPTTTESWDGGKMVSRISNDSSASTFKKMYAYIDPEKDEDTKSAYKFPHHEVNADGKVGAANVKGCQSAIGVLNGAMGGADVPGSDKEGIWRHVARHLRDADMTPAELRGKQAKAKDQFATNEEALKRAEKIGCTGSHRMTADGQTVYMPCKTHVIYEETISADDSPSSSYNQEPDTRSESQMDDETAINTTDTVALDTGIIKQQLEITRLRLKLNK